MSTNEDKGLAGGRVERAPMRKKQNIIRRGKGKEWKRVERIFTRHHVPHGLQRFIEAGRVRGGLYRRTDGDGRVHSCNGESRVGFRLPCPHRPFC